MREERVIGLILVLSILLAACTQQRAPLGTEEIEAQSLKNLVERQVLFGGEAADNQFGASVALDGNRMVVACECRDNDDIAYIFERTSTGGSPWKLVTSLKGNKATFSYSAYDVAIGGDTVVVSSPEVETVHIFSRNQGGKNRWGEVKKLVSVANEGFGISVDISGDTLIVGAYISKVGTTEYQGSAYIFQRNQGGANAWGKVKQLVANDGSSFDNFGGSVGISGDTVIVGAYGHDVGSNDLQGAAYIFQQDRGGKNQWGQVKKLTASDGLAFDFFGDAVDIDSDTVVVGAYFTYYNEGKGSAYLFQRNQGGKNNWGEIKKLVPDPANQGAYFGKSVSIYNNTVVVSAVYDTVNANTNQGSVYVFRRNHKGAKWGQIQRLTASDAAPTDPFGPGDYFGASVDVSRRSVVVSAPLNDLGEQIDQGAVYVFE